MARRAPEAIQNRLNSCGANALVGALGMLAGDGSAAAVRRDAGYVTDRADERYLPSRPAVFFAMSVGVGHLCERLSRSTTAMGSSANASNDSNTARCTPSLSEEQAERWCRALVEMLVAFGPMKPEQFAFVFNRLPPDVHERPAALFNRLRDMFDKAVNPPKPRISEEPPSKPLPKKYQREFLGMVNHVEDTWRQPTLPFARLDHIAA